MSRSTFARRSWVVASLFVALVMGTGAALCPPARAQSARQTTSLKFVPEDAAFYWSLLRVREQIDAIKNSKALAKLMSSSLAKKAQDQAKELPAQAGAPDLDTVKGLMDSPDFKPLVDLLIDAGSHEIFIYGDTGFSDLFQHVNEIQSQLEAIRLEASRQGLADDDESTDRKMSDLLVAHIGKMRVPKLMLGCKLSDPKLADPQLAQLEGMLTEFTQMQPGWQGRLAKETIGGGQFLTLRLDGSLLPWEMIGPADNPQRFAQVVEALKKLPLVVSLGVRHGYLLLAIGETNDHLKSLGTAKLLVDRPELAPLAKHADKPLTSLAFASQRIREGNSYLDSQVKSLSSAVEQLAAVVGIDDSLKSELLADLKALSADIQRYQPKAGAYTSFAFLTPRGREGYSYDWSQDLASDATQKLTILDHVGGNPLLFAAGRQKYAPEDYEVAVKWLRRGFYYFEQIGLDQFEPEQREIYDKIRVELVPLAERLDDVTRAKWIPAFKDGQSALVIDAKVGSKQWHKSLPASPNLLPMLEVGLVYGVSDAKLLQSASADYLQLTQSAIKRLHLLLPEVVPDYDFPLPASRQFPEGTVYYYSLPTDWGADPQIAPNAALSDKTLALSLMPKTGLRLVKPTPLAIDGPVAAAKDRPLAAASYVNVAGMIDAVTPWLDFSVDHAEAQGLIAPAEIDLTPQETKDGTRALLEFVKSLRSMSSITYAENGSLVTHSEWVVVDAP
ncbi:MAG: hypothetical protein SFU86_23390 [Pirellulaceae bacterium]|nr:hypothetical protein [Pirellulaceae bacterium]